MTMLWSNIYDGVFAFGLSEEATLIGSAFGLVVVLVAKHSAEMRLDGNELQIMVNLTHSGRKKHNCRHPD